MQKGFDTIETIYYSQDHNAFRILNTPDLIEKLSPAKQKVWEVLEAEYEKCEGEFRLDMTDIARGIGCSRAMVYWTLRTLIEANLLEKVREVRGRGNHSVYRLLWTFWVKNVTPSRITTLFDSPPRKNVTKEGSTYKFFAMHFRKLTANSSLSSQQGVVVSELLDRLVGQSYELWHKTANRLRQKLDEKPTLRNFYYWLRKYLDREIRYQQRKEATETNLQNRKKRRKNKKAKIKEERPPDPSDFEDLQEWGKAIAEYSAN